MAIISFIFFSALVGIITFIKTKKSNLATTDGYFLGGRSLTSGIITGSLMLTNLSALNFIGMSAQAYSHNMSVMGWEVCSAIILIVVALFLLPRYLKQGITTIPEFIEARFDKGTSKFITILFLVSYVVNALPVTLYAGSVAISEMFRVEELLNIGYVESIWICGAIIGSVGAIYAICGGLRAVAISDSINGVILVISGLLIPFFALLYMGKGNIIDGFEMLGNIPHSKFNAIGSNTDPLPFSTLFTGLLLVNLYYWGTDQCIIQRALAAVNLKEGQKGVIWAGFFKILTPFIVIIPGLMAYEIFGDSVQNPDTAYPKLVNLVLPTSLIGLFATAMIGAILSSFNSVLNSVATLFALNIYKPMFGKNKNDDEVVKIGKIFAIIIAIIAIVTSPFIMYAPKGLLDYLQTINGFFNVPIFTIIFMGYVAKRTPPIAAKIAITFFVITYGITQLFWDTGLHFLHISAILFIISCLIMYIIGKMYPTKDEFHLEEKHIVEIKPWDKRFRASGFIIFVMVSMYIIFSPIGLASESGFNIKTIVALIINAIICFIGAILFEKKFVKEK